jgi:tetratricopeptide (TPR) repeat protein
MSRRDRPSAHHRSVPAVESPEAARARVQSLIAAGKTREALDLAKQLLKETRSVEAEALVIEAYEARIGAMLAQGLHDEARALVALVGERFPAYRRRIAPLMSHSTAVAASDLRALLAELAAATPARRTEIEAILTRELRDPRLLADADTVPADDPLRRAAGAVSDLLAAVTSGPLRTGALAALDGIPRHSPLAPWKLLIRALDAYYRRADGTMIANLDAIPPRAAPARLAPVLRHLIGEPGGPDQRSPAAGALVKGVSGTRAMLRQHLPRLDRALEARDRGAALATVERIMPLFEFEPAPVKRSFAATILWRWHGLNLNPKPLIEALRRDRRDLDWQRETQRLIAITIERVGAWDEALLVWDAYLTAATRARAMPATGRAPARVLLHMAELFPKDRDDVLDTLGVDSDTELEALVQAGEFPECFDRGRLLARARHADPDPRVFRALVAHWEPLDPRRAETEAEAWREAHPRDLEPLLHLARAAERRGAHQKALELLDTAEAINRLHPEVRQSRFRLLLASAERRIREGRFALALADLDRLDKEPLAATGDTWAYLAALRSVATRRNGDGADAARLHEQLASRLGSPTLLALISSSVAECVGGEPLDEPAPASPAEAVQALARASDLLRAMDRPLAVMPALLARVERDLGGASAADLHSLCVGGIGMGRPSLTYAAAGEGLATEGPLLHRFLLARGRALSAASSHRDRDRAGPCLRAARELAGRARDMDAVREASTAIDALARRSDSAPPWARHMPVADAEPPTAQEIARLITAERSRRQAPSFTAEKVRRKRRKAPRQRQPDLFDDFLAFMDKPL